MKNIYLIIFGFLIALSGYSQIINIPDANFKAKLLESDSGVGIAYGVGGSFKIDANNNGEIEVSEVLPVRTLNIRYSNISDLTGIEYFINMTELRCETNSLTTLDVTMLPVLETLGVYDNELIDLNIAGLSNLQNIYASRNSLSSIDLTGLIGLSRIDVDGNNLSNLDFSETPNLHFIRCFDNQLTTLDVSPLSELYNMDCSSNQLETLNIKNGFSEHTLDFSGNDNLQFICADDSQIVSIQDKINAYGYTNCFTNSLCSFIQGEDFYTILGHVTYDEDGNGCGSNDVDYPELLINLSDGSNAATATADSFGDYTYSLQAGMFVLTPSLENTTYFSITPETVNVNFPADANANVRDFCVTPNGVYPDLKITMTSIDDAYDLLVTYSLVYTNQGTITQNGTVSLTYENDMAVFSSSVPDISGQSANELTWDFSDLKPFESRAIEFTMDVSSVEPEPLGGIIVNYVATIDSSLAETTPSDNVFEYNEPFYCCLLSTNEFLFSDYFSLYPNPTEGYINLKLKKGINVKAIVIYNVLGQEVKKLAFKNDHIKIDVSNLEVGHYFIKILTPEKVFNTRFIKI
jgi:hypothetical protein